MPTFKTPLTMSSSVVLGALAAFFTVAAAIFGLLAWGKSYFEGKDKDVALDKFKTEALAKQTQFETQLETQREKTEEQRAETARANERAELARKETAEIYRKLGPRYISAPDREKFAELTKDAPKPAGVIFVGVDERDSSEANDLKLDIIRMLGKAGYKCERLVIKPPDQPAFPGFSGVRLELLNLPTRIHEPWIAPLTDAFEKIGIWLRLTGPTVLGPQPPSDGAAIMVGVKRAPEFDPPWELRR